MWFLVVYLIFLHALFVNNYEKLLVQSVFGSHRRPCHADDRPTETVPLKALGMPSGHTEVAVIVATSLASAGIISVPVAILLVIATGLQRIVARRHTPAQVLAGFLVGVVYASAYVAMRNHAHPAILYAFPVLVAIALVVAITKITDDKVRRPVPAWVDPSLHKMIDKKRNVSFAGKMGHVAIMPTSMDFALYRSWEQLEHDTDDLVHRLGDHTYDVVVGIKSGGAIIADYVAARTSLPKSYVKLAKNCDKNIPDSIAEYLWKAMPLHRFDDEEYRVCEPVDPQIAIEGKRVLLVDELVDTGETILATKHYLLSAKHAGRVTMACLVNRRRYTTRFKERFVGGNAEGCMVWPWGYGN